MSARTTKPSRPANNDNLIGRMVDDAADRLPEKYGQYVRQIKPVVVGIANGCDAAWPYVTQAWAVLQHIWEIMQPYNPQQFFPVFAGLVLCFFGGSYLTLVAAAEAIRLSVWDRFLASFRVLYKNYCIAAEKNEADNSQDADGDGVADVRQISNKDLFTRKVLLVGKAVNPEQCSEAAGVLWTGFLSVLATVRIKFAQYITLGCAMGDMARDNFGPKIQPLIHDALPQDLKKWDATIVRQIFATLGVMFALCMQQIVGGFHAAVRGAQLTVLNGAILARKHGYLREDFDEHSKEAHAAAMVLAFFGFFWQLRNGFAVPFPLNLLFLPATMLEWILSVSLTVGL